MAFIESGDLIELRKPTVSRDLTYFYEGLSKHQLLIQRCGSCGFIRPAPGPMCPQCRSTDWVAEPRPLTGTIYSFSIHHHPPLPEHQTPHGILLVELDDGTLITGALGDPVDDPELAIGAGVKAEFFETSGGFTFYQFRLARTLNDD